MKKIFLLLLLAMPATTLFSQKDGIYKDAGEQRLFDSGKNLFEEKMYQVAYEHFSELLVKHPDDQYLKYLTGICGVFISSKHDEGMAYLLETKAKNPKVADLDYYMALLYHKTYKFDTCIELATRLVNRPGLGQEFKANLKRIIENCNNGKELVTTTVTANASIQNLGGPPNTEGAEYSPVITSDEETILFTYRGKLSKGGLRDIYGKQDKYGFHGEDVYMSKKINGKWQQAVGLDEINTESNEAVLAVSNDGQQLFVYKADAKNGGDIYVSRLQGDGFAVPEKMSGINTGSWEGSISLSGDQKKIIFASDRPGGLGGKDLYEAVKLPNNTWGNIKNLGEAINTPFDDDAPFIHPDGRTLVFSSKGHNSIGGFDIFSSAINEADSSWKKPVNVGYPMNTTDDDIYYAMSADGKKGFFASAKTGGFGDQDIYMEESFIFSKNSYLTVIKGKITENLLPYSADISIYFAKDKRHYGIFKSNELSGNYLVSLPAGNDYLVSFYHPILGEKLVTLNAKANEYAEVNANINFGLKDTSTVANDGIDLVQAVFNTSGQGTVTDLGSSNGELKKLSRAQLIEVFGNSPEALLKYIVQLGAYRKAENFTDKQLKGIKGIKHVTITKDAEPMTVFYKEFNTWKSADTFLNSVKAAGKKDAFITVNYQGQRYYLKDLVEAGVLKNKF